MPESTDAPASHPLDPSVLFDEPEPIDDDTEDVAAEDLCLMDDDDESSLVTSFMLHMVAEHQVWDAAGMDDDEAVALHAHLHADATSWITNRHEEGDLRFRVRRALAGICERDENPDVAEGMLTDASAEPPTTPA